MSLKNHNYSYSFNILCCETNLSETYIYFMPPLTNVSIVITGVRNWINRSYQQTEAQMSIIGSKCKWRSACDIVWKLVLCEIILVFDVCLPAHILVCWKGSGTVAFHCLNVCYILKHFCDSSAVVPKVGSGVFQRSLKVFQFSMLKRGIV